MKKRIIFSIIGILIVAIGSISWLVNEESVDTEQNNIAMHMEFQWFLDQRCNIIGLQHQIKYLTQDISNLNIEYNGTYGDNMSDWPLNIQSLYNARLSGYNHNLDNDINNANWLISWYNEKSSKFDWDNFKNEKFIPEKSFELLNIIQ